MEKLSQLDKNNRTFIFDEYDPNFLPRVVTERKNTEKKGNKISKSELKTRFEILILLFQTNGRPIILYKK